MAAYSLSDFANDDKMQEAMRATLGPQAIDRQIRQAIEFCWMMLPKDRRTVEAVETEIRRLVDRAFVDLKEDRQAFGFSLDN